MAIKKPLFICFEGVEGSGKSTQAKLLYKFIKKKITKNVILTREPGGTIFSEKIRNLILDKKTNISLLSEFLLLMAARNEDRKSTRLNSSHPSRSRMPSSA